MPNPAPTEAEEYEEDYPATPRLFDHDNGVDYDDLDPIGEATGSDIL